MNATGQTFLVFLVLVPAGLLKLSDSSNPVLHFQFSHPGNRLCNFSSYHGFLPPGVTGGSSEDCFSIMQSLANEISSS